MPHYGFRVSSIRHNPALSEPPVVREKGRVRLGRRLSHLGSKMAPASDTVEEENPGRGNDGVHPENGSDGTPSPTLRRRTTLGDRVSAFASNGPVFTHTPHDASMALLLGPLPLVSIIAFCMTIALMAIGACWNDGTAVIAVCTISVASSIIEYAAWWTPDMTGRRF